ncbi:MAG: ATP-grasp domain-containing protein [Chloroflexi bacterium]|nr:ATP-grasp domain-containing protein [Chloroflexota bacterium]
MFKKILIANRGEIAVRIIRTCRDLGIWTVAIYHPDDLLSLHVRLADEAMQLSQRPDVPDATEIFEIADATGVEAIHPGYGFGAERYFFVRPCEQAGLIFIGPSSEIIKDLSRKVTMLETAKKAGIATPEFSPLLQGAKDLDLIRMEAEVLGYPLVIKSARGGRGHGTQLVRKADMLESAVRRAEQEAFAVYGNRQLYLEKAIHPARHVDVQILADEHGNIIHLGERCSTLQQHSQKIISETPAPCMSPAQRQQVQTLAIKIAHLFNYQNAGAVEFLIDDEGGIFFSDFKARIQVEHPITEMVSGIDIVEEQIRIAGGEPLRLKQEDVSLQGSSMLCRINAEDPWNHFLPSPGTVRRFRLPAGMHVRVDTYCYSGCEVPVYYDPLIAKTVTWGETREACILRMQRALQDLIIQGIPNNLPLHQGILDDPQFVAGDYSTNLIAPSRFIEPASDEDLRDLAIAAAVAYMRRNKTSSPVLPERLSSGWHRSSRRLPN